MLESYDFPSVAESAQGVDGLMPKIIEKVGGATNGGSLATIDLDTLVEGVQGLEALLAKLSGASDGAVIKLASDIDGQVEYTNPANVTLDLNGFKIESDKDWTIKNNGGTLTIKDSTNGKGKVINTMNSTDKGIAVWARTGSIVIESGYFENASNYESTLYLGTKVTTASFTVNGGKAVNVAEGGYHWKEGWDAICFNVYNLLGEEGLARFQVKGGLFSQNPEQGDDKIGGTFLAEGKTVEETAEGLFLVK